ncbi:hypothetical protein MKX07_008523 [Trichoderma sp. CBMAI-0711]|nr:hypothetical protein MKX07_008523 [Trichoderma sp. CBMAI-0711]
MESPHEHQQSLLLSRIITNVVWLITNNTETGRQERHEPVLIATITHTAQEINVQNMNVELVAQMFKNYQSNVLFHLEATDNLKPPS